MEIPEPNEYAKAHGHNPFSPRWEKWLSAVRQSILSAQPQAGRHVTTDEHPGKGTVINVDDASARRPGGGVPAIGACCIDGACSIITAAACADAGGNYLGNDTTCEGVDCAHGACCYDDGTCDDLNPADCAATSGHYQGDGTTCADTDCTHGGDGTSGACCVGTACSIASPLDCFNAGGTYQGDSTTCDPNPCGAATGACCNTDTGACTVTTEADCAGTYQGDGTTCEFGNCCYCGFDDFESSGRKFLTYQRTITGNITSSETNSCAPPNDVDVEITASCSATFEEHFDPSSGSTSCNTITDIDTSSSSHSRLFNGSETDDCSRGDIECFCSSGPPFNQCDGGTFYGDSTNCGNADRNTSVSTTATTRITTTTFSQSTSIPCSACPDCSVTCTVSGTYTVTETLSDECMPVE